jgi:predicted O-methyltransferase YrrM
LGFVPLLWFALQSEISSLWYLTGFLLLAATSLGSIRTRVPLFLSSPQAAAALANHLPDRGRLLDLGCGLGGPLARLATLRPDARLSGVEAAPLNWLVARLRLAGRASVELGSLWETDLGRYDVVYAYLSPAPMPRLWEKAREEMRPGSLLVSNSFAIPGVTPDEVVELHDRAQARLLIWRMR